MIFGSQLGSPFRAKILDNGILERMPEPLVSQGGPKMVQRWPQAPKLDVVPTRNVVLCLLDDFLCILRSMLLSVSLLVLLAAFFY